MGDRAGPADTCGNRRHHLHLGAHQKGLPTAKVHNLEQGVGHLTLVVDIDLDPGVALDAGKGIDHNAAFHVRSPSARAIHFLSKKVGFLRNIGDAIA